MGRTKSGDNQDIRTVHYDLLLLTEARARPKAILKKSAICSED
jgi:hypothetical protein